MDEEDEDGQIPYVRKYIRIMNMHLAQCYECLSAIKNIQAY